jgi:ketosteroid isomerase-like protein
MSEAVAIAMLQRMADAINDHDLPALILLFHPDYASIQPAHPERSFRGRDRVAENWAWVFDNFDDFEAEVVDLAARGDTVWCEWDWKGTSPDGDEIHVRGVMILTVDDGLFQVGRLYMEPLR